MALGGLLGMHDICKKNALLFDLWSVPKTFLALTDATKRFLHNSGIRMALNFLDNFLLNLALCEELGCTVAIEKKTAGPSMTLTFLGIELGGQLRLPQDYTA